MKYQVIARKFRPQVFQDMVGQTPIVQTLQNAIQTNRVGHAYVFSGPRGVGKTTAARILAKGLNCQEGPTASPCGVCPSCKEIAASQSMDVLEIDAASNTGVDNIRELRENARYAPARDRYKIFIIDEAHQLSSAAFNALLKTLEEPPPHVVFIMATTERHKLPATILSRCQAFVFRTISSAEIHAHLSRIAEREGVVVDERALNYIVRASEGSMRDAQSLLDQIIAFGGQSVGADDARAVLGFIPGDLLDRALDALVESDSRRLLELVAEIVDQGLHLQQFAREFTSRIRDILLIKLKLDDSVLANAMEKEELGRRAALLSEQDLIRYFDLLLRLENELRWTAQPRFHLEVGLVKMARMGHLRDIEEVLRDLRQGSAPAPAEPERGARPAVRPEPAASKPSATESRPAGPLSALADLRPSGPRPAPPASATPRPAPPKAVPPDTPRPAPSKAAPAETRSTPRSEPAGRPVPAPPPERPAAPNPQADAPAGSGAASEPLVRRFLEVFRGDIAHVKPLKEDDQ
ncbi:MAG TPA: DNA polymerase III subunit gamma/tau [Terriglobia bacterium]|nr:DNA polymerase III subunit gamma/tau [Terriglobia bacterium]